MDSRLLNVFHDDPFDGNYVKYENDTTDLWSADGTESLGLQLTETLNGILPIDPTDASDSSADDIYSAGTMLKQDYANLHEQRKDNSAFHNNSKENALIFAEDFNKAHMNRNGRQIIQTYTNDSHHADDSDDDGDDDDLDGRLSQLSGATFRTRTDSSSIGDYESHSSDYDDEDDEEVPLSGNGSCNKTTPTADGDLVSAVLAEDDLLLSSSPSVGKSRTFSTNTICSDVDALVFDASTFDLAEFITKDDFAFTAPTATAPKPKANEPLISSSVVHVISSKNNDSDSDSDVIVDVETVEMDDDEELQKLKGITNGVTNYHNEGEQAEREEEEEEEDDEVPFVDNVKKDPIWNPKPGKKPETPVKEVKNESTTTATNSVVKTASAAASIKIAATTTTTKNTAPPKTNRKTFSLVPSKRQSDLLKGKLNVNRNSCKMSAKNKKLSPGKATSDNKSTIQTTTMQTNQGGYVRPSIKVGIGQGGKNLSLISQQLQQTTASELSSEDNASPLKPNNSKLNDEQTVEPPKRQQQEQQRVKRKLNLEQYKQRRCGGDAVATIKEEDGIKNNKIPKIERDPKSNPGLPIPAVSSPSKHSPAVTAIVNTLKNNNNNNQLINNNNNNPNTPTSAIDPITVAKNKVLRMQQLKKAQQLKIIDSTISAKVPRVTKLCSMKEIVRDTCYYEAIDEESKKLTNCLKSQADYEEIIIVSTSCNTEVSMPPLEPENTVPITKNENVSRSLLKSSTLLYNISNNLKTNVASGTVNIPTNSLIASIQDVVVKKSIPPVVDQTTTTTTTPTTLKCQVDGNGELIAHGEDKIIMHLRKDRIRVPTSTMSTQTDLHPDFPPLTFKKLLTGSDATSLHKSRDRERRKAHRRCYRKHKTSSSGGLAGSAAASSDGSSSSSSESDSDSYSSSVSSVGGRRSYRSRSRSQADGYASSFSTERLRSNGDPNANGGGYSSRSSRRHRSSVSSSYSESDRATTRPQRNRQTVKATKKQRAKRYSSRSTSTSSLSDYSDEDRSRGRTRSRSPYYRRSRSPSNVGNRRRNNNYSNNNKNANINNVNNNVSQPAVEERRIVYVGRIEQETTKEMLRRKFIRYGTIKQITIHYKDTGMKYGFVTYERSQDAFTVIDGGSRDPLINMYDISFGGRRAFCRASYADLDNAGINTYQSYVFPKAPPPPKEDDSFEALLLKVKAKMNANKAAASTTAAPTAEPPTAVTQKTEVNEAENRM